MYRINNLVFPTKQKEKHSKERRMGEIKVKGVFGSETINQQVLGGVVAADQGVSRRNLEKRV